jgi:hypothetical protein
MAPVAVKDHDACHRGVIKIFESQVTIDTCMFSMAVSALGFTQFFMKQYESGGAVF